MWAPAPLFVHFLPRFFPFRSHWDKMPTESRTARITHETWRPTRAGNSGLPGEPESGHHACAPADPEDSPGGHGPSRLYPGVQGPGTGPRGGFGRVRPHAGPVCFRPPRQLRRLGRTHGRHPRRRRGPLGPAHAGHLLRGGPQRLERSRDGLRGPALRIVMRFLATFFMLALIATALEAGPTGVPVAQMVEIKEGSSEDPTQLDVPMTVTFVAGERACVMATGWSRDGPEAPLSLFVLDEGGKVIGSDEGAYSLAVIWYP